MSTYTKSFVAIAFAILCLQATGAYAQATRTWVSGVGDDANPCSRTAPCKTFAGAISKTAAGGEINVLDPGGFGGVTITKAISIISDHTEAGVLVSGTNGITISAGSTDRVVLQGLDIEGLGTSLNGVNIVSGGTVVIRRCDIRNFLGSPGVGVNLQTSAGNTRVLIEDTFISNNQIGAKVSSSTGGNKLKVLNAIFDSNVSSGIQVNGSSNTLVLSGSTFIAGLKALDLQNGGIATSYGGNILPNGDAPTSTLPQQ